MKYQSRFVLTVSAILAVGLITSFAQADVSHVVAGNSTPPVTEICLGCICEASSGCNPSKGCVGDICGLFSITWPYWADGGKPTLANEDPNSPSAYKNCVTEPYCAAKAVQGYMSRFGQDCNGDHVVNCLDYAAIHVHGGYGCQQPLPPNYKSKFDQCLSQVDVLTHARIAT